MQRQHKKGQAAMEFLMTYGWAILAAIIAIGVLAYFGVFNLSAPSQATVNAPWYANAWNVDANADTITLEFRNNGGETLEIQSLVLTVTDPFSDICTDSTITSVDAGTLQTVIINLATECAAVQALADGDNVRANIALNYRRPGSTIDLTSTGQITGAAA